MRASCFVVPKYARRIREKTCRKTSLGLLFPVGLVAADAVSMTSIPAAQAADSVVTLTPMNMTCANTGVPDKVYSGYSDPVVSKSQYATYLKFDTSTHVREEL